jgi:hypothetical protein
MNKTLIVFALLLATVAVTLAQTCATISTDAAFCKDFFPTKEKVYSTFNTKTYDDFAKNSYTSFIAATNGTIPDSCAKPLKEAICINNMRVCRMTSGIVSAWSSCKGQCTKVFNACKDTIKEQDETDYNFYCDASDIRCYGSSSATAIKASAVLTFVAIIFSMMF